MEASSSMQNVEKKYTLCEDCLQQLHYSVPVEAELVENSQYARTYKLNDANGYIDFSVIETDNEGMTEDQILCQMKEKIQEDQLNTGGLYRLKVIEETQINKKKALYYSYLNAEDESDLSRVDVYAIIVNDSEYITVTFALPKNAFSNYVTCFNEIVDSLKIEA
jgi:hypothetical protein